MSRILVVDDKEMMRDSVATILGRRGHTVVTAPGGEAALEKITAKRPDAVVTDLQMPGMSGLQLLAAIRGIDQDLPVVFMTAYGSVEPAVEAMREGAFDYVTKPFGGDELAIAVERAMEHGRLRRENEVLRAAAGTPVASAAGTRLVGDGPTMTATRSQIERIGDSHGTVLITGESGTGKEVAPAVSTRRVLVATAPSSRSTARPSPPACWRASSSGTRSAFTADKLRKGRFELADGGTLLLDEISEIAPELQAKLLRVLQEQTFERVGSSQTLSVDVRVIATTNRDLATEVDADGSGATCSSDSTCCRSRCRPSRSSRGSRGPANHFLAAVGTRGRPQKLLSADAIALRCLAGQRSRAAEHLRADRRPRPARSPGRKSSRGCRTRPTRSRDHRRGTGSPRRSRPSTRGGRRHGSTAVQDGIAATAINARRIERGVSWPPSATASGPRDRGADARLKLKKEEDQVSGRPLIPRHRFLPGSRIIGSSVSPAPSGGSGHVGTGIRVGRQPLSATIEEPSGGISCSRTPPRIWTRPDSGPRTSRSRSSSRP